MNWGIIGYGEITPYFIKDLSLVKDQKLYAIASISKFSILASNNDYVDTRIYSSYEQLYQDPNIDIVYISTINSLHKENALAALRARKHVLCEKPLGVSKDDVVEILAEAKKQNRFLMEGMWTRFLPAYKQFKYLLSSYTIGKVNFVRADFGFYSDWDSKRRLKNKDLFGGTILDNADYNIFLCQDIFPQKPLKVSAFGRFIDTGVEDMCGVMLQYANGGIAQLFSSFHQKTKQEALIYGDRGYIHLNEYWHGTSVELFNELGQKKWEFPFKSYGFEYEIKEVQHCINNNQIESNLLSHSMCLEVAEVMDDIIKQVKKNS